MRTIFSWLMGMSLLVGSLHAFGQRHRIHLDDTIFLSFPRSGTHLTFAHLQALTGRPIEFFQTGGKLRMKEGFSLFSIDRSQRPIFHLHEGKLLFDLKGRQRKLLFILRNYKECIPRHREVSGDAEKIRELFASHHEFVKLYAENLQMFDSWDPAYRLLIHYEDWLKDQRGQVIKIAAFLGVDPPSPMEEEWLAAVKKASLAYYDQQYGSYSKGSDPLYHSKAVDSACLEEVDGWMLQYYPELFETYLGRYLEDHLRAL